MGTNCKEDPLGTGYDRDQLVHVPNRLFVPNGRSHSSEGSRVHPSGLLRFGHYLQMRSRLGHLSDLLCQVWQEGSLAMRGQAARSMRICVKLPCVSTTVSILGVDF